MPEMPVADTKNAFNKSLNNKWGLAYMGHKKSLLHRIIIYIYGQEHTKEESFCGYIAIFVCAITAPIGVRLLLPYVGIDIHTNLKSLSEGLLLLSCVIIYGVASILIVYSSLLKIIKLFKKIRQ